MGAKPMVDPEGSLKATTAIDFVVPRGVRLHLPGGRRRACRCGHQGAVVPRREGGASCTTCRARCIENMDELPFVAPVYQRDLNIENYFIGYLKHPVRQLLHRPRLPLEVHVLPVAADRRRSPLPRALRRKRHRGSALDQGEHARSEGDHVRRRHLHGHLNLPRVEAIARGMGELGMTWSCNAKANVPYKT